VKIAVAGGTGAVGKPVTEVARERGHEVIVLSRQAGVDLTNSAGLAGALEGVDVVIDVTSVQTQSADASRRFFGTVTSTLLDAELAAGVRHHVALSIVGSDKAPFGYYAGKQEQERLVAAGRVPWTILRATQFHEFARQIFDEFRLGPIALVPRMVSQPVAAREVAERLVSLAEGAPAGHATELGGPEVLRMSTMVKKYARAIGSRGPVLELPLPGGFGRAMRDGTVLSGPAADRGIQTYDEWVTTL